MCTLGIISPRTISTIGGLFSILFASVANLPRTLHCYRVVTLSEMPGGFGKRQGEEKNPATGRGFVSEGLWG